MFVLGHLGFGNALLKFAKLPRAALFLGCLLPDLIDKPLYYGLVLATGKRAGELGLISGSRTLGHTGILLLLLLFAAALGRSPTLLAVGLGMLTHLFLDELGDLLYAMPLGRSMLLAIFFPLFGRRFPVMPFADVSEHFLSVLGNPYVIFGEVAGAALLVYDHIKIKARLESQAQSKPNQT